jgi:hypothetical protein
MITLAMVVFVAVAAWTTTGTRFLVLAHRDRGIAGLTAVEHRGADDSQQTADWLTALRAPGYPTPSRLDDHDPDADLRRMGQAIDAAVAAFRTRLDEAVGAQWAELIAKAERESAEWLRSLSWSAVEGT